MPRSISRNLAKFLKDPEYRYITSQALARCIELADKPPSSERPTVISDYWTAKRERELVAEAERERDHRRELAMIALRAQALKPPQITIRPPQERLQ